LKAGISGIKSVSRANWNFWMDLPLKCFLDALRAPARLGSAGLP
jgi:hypothetical protein